MAFKTHKAEDGSKEGLRLIDANVSKGNAICLLHSNGVRNVETTATMNGCRDTMFSAIMSDFITFSYRCLRLQGRRGNFRVMTDIVSSRLINDIIV